MSIQITGSLESLPWSCQVPFGVRIKSPRSAVQRSQDVFVAGPFPFVNELTSDEPHERVPPEDHLHDHMDGCGEIVVAANVAELVGNDSRELTRCQVALDVGRYQEDRTPQSTDARFHQTRHGANSDVIGNGQR